MWCALIAWARSFSTTLFKRNPGTLRERAFITLGSQIGNPFVRDCFAGCIEPLDARMWYHLYNPDDHVFTAELRV